jgi:hypothetical protein
MAESNFTRTISGREIEFHRPTDAQILMVGRLLRVSRGFTDMKEDEVDREQIQGGVERMSMILDIIDSMVVNPSDRDWLETGIINGKLDLEQLMGALNEEQEPANRAQRRATARKPTARARRS